MSWLTAPLRKVAPPKPAQLTFKPNQSVWQLSLDQIESDTGQILSKKYVGAENAGSSTFCFDTGNVLYSKLRPYLNKVSIPDEPGIATTELIPLRPDTKILNPHFLAYYLRSRGFVNQASHHVAGAKMPRVVMDWFWNHEIRLAPPSEQARIVEILDEGDQLRRLRRATDAKAAQILRALFLKMFGDPATNPRGLKKESLGKLIKVKSGDFLPAKDMVENGTSPVYGGNGVNGFHDKYMFEERKVILGRVGAYCGAVHYSEPRAWITDNALYVSEKFADLDDRYLVAALEQANLNQYAGRAGQPLISGSRIYPVEILVPLETEQRVFVKSAAALGEMERERDKAGRNLEQFWGQLMQQAFSGQLTAKWRAAHMKNLLVEMEEQTRLLNLQPYRELENIQ